MLNILKLNPYNYFKAFFSLSKVIIVQYLPETRDPYT